MKRFLGLLLVLMLSVFAAAEAFSAVVTQEFGKVRVHTYTSSSYANAVVVENDKLTVFDVFGDEGENKEFKSFVDSLDKPVDRVFISHADDHHWIGVEKIFPKTPIYSVDSVQIKGQDAGKDLDVLQLSDGKAVVDGVNYEFVTYRDLGAWVIKMPALKVALVHHLGYVGVHVPIPPLEKRLEILKNLERAGYTWFIGGHGIAMESGAYNKEVGAYYDFVAGAVASSKTSQEAKVMIVKAYPQWGGDVLLDIFLPLFYQR